MSSRQVDSINGVRIRDAESLRQIARRLLVSPPADVRFWQFRHTRVAYPERAVFDRLANMTSTLPFVTARLPLCNAPDAPGQFRLCVGEQELVCDSARDRACASFVSEVEKAASTVNAPRTRARVDCTDLRRVPTLIAVRFHDRDVELRYVDWMPQMSVDDASER